MSLASLQAPDSSDASREAKLHSDLPPFTTYDWLLRPPSSSRTTSLKDPVETITQIATYQLDVARLIVQWVFIGVVTTTLLWMLQTGGANREFAKAYSQFPWKQAETRVCRLEAAGIRVFVVEEPDSGGYAVYRRAPGLSEKGCPLNFDDPKGAFSYAEFLLGKDLHA
jgi:hypothetical protein